MPLSIAILAAGLGTRMKSARPKVLHSLAGRPLLQHVVDSCRALEPEQFLVVIGHGADAVERAMTEQGLVFVEQVEQLGTGHALQQCLPQLAPGNDVLVLFGDVPLIRAETLAQLIDCRGDAALAILGFEPDDPFGYGRILRDGDSVVAIVEEKDCTAEQKTLRECFTGIMLIRGDCVQELAGRLDNDNAQNEYYLTDLVAHAVADGEQVVASLAGDADEVAGVNNQQQLAALEAVYRARQADSLMSHGVKLADPARIDVRGDLRVGRDVEIDVNCVFEGSVTLADGVRIGANCVLRDCIVGEGSQILPMTSIDDARLGRGVSIGPYARIRPGTDCADGVKIGNFVETKQAQIGQGSKVNHLSYVGDTEMGSGVNIGAGTITCNYDGANKHRTVIEDGVFIGSDSQLVAPVRIEKDATIGAGSTITKTAPAGKLTVSRARQVTIGDWAKPKKKQDA
ncbi:MAG: bifunctional UDP-N-acetylglucosamine diphosphorylase/glucosamine-1-phosphate N-acetyltransferase GlmU [Gammaproteobacteria bacterium]|nr:bifunctional UDP-N-acetylglucosamine diphosphorylase/glucosamine-1-phosphate N-acetyltransferase GlmU [Gammaproteobacteria bacterium]